MTTFFATTRYVGKVDTAARTLMKIQHKVAVSSIPASALRGQGSPGLIGVAREFFRVLPLGQFGVTSSKRFTSRLDAVTEDLLRRFPRKARHWGVARKAVNLFLRDAFYNQFLSSKYHLSRSARFYELPLDRRTAEALTDFDDERDLPRWLGVKHLTEKCSALFQEAATEIAADDDHSCERIHLDAYFWPQGPSIDSA